MFLKSQVKSSEVKKSRQVNASQKSKKIKSEEDQ